MKSVKVYVPVRVEALQRATLAAKAEKDQTTVSAIIRAALDAYLK
jgi:hypothetical protein